MRPALVRVGLAACAGLAAVGASRAAPSAWLAQGATGVVGALWCLMVLRSKDLPRDVLGRVGGAPLVAAGALAGLGGALGVVELSLVTTLRWSTALAAAPVAVVAAVLTAVSALRLSTASASRRSLTAVALLAFGAAAVATWLLVATHHLVPPLPGWSGAMFGHTG